MSSGPRTVLITETGRLGGGSFVSLDEHVRALDSSRYHPVILFTSPTNISQKLLSDGFDVHHVEDLVYSYRERNLWRGGLARATTAIESGLPRASLLWHQALHRSLVRTMNRIVRQDGVGLIHTNNQLHRDMFALEPARRAGIPHIGHLRTLAPVPRRLASILAHRARAQGISFIANSATTKAHWVSLGLDASSISVVPNIVRQHPKQSVDLHARFSIPADFKNIVGCIANFYPSKGHDFLIEGFRRLAHGRRDTALVLMGHGPGMPDVRRQVAKMGEGSKVFFGGYIDEPGRLIAGLSCLVVPSRQEAFGRTVLEGMMARVPVVATAVGGMEELIDNGENGLLVEYGNSGALATAIRRVIDDSVLSSKLRLGGTETAAQATCRERYGMQIVDRYDHAVGHHRALTSTT